MPLRILVHPISGPWAFQMFGAKAQSGLVWNSSGLGIGTNVDPIKS